MAAVAAAGAEPDGTTMTRTRRLRARAFAAFQLSVLLVTIVVPLYFLPNSIDVVGINSSLLENVEATAKNTLSTRVATSSCRPAKSWCVHGPSDYWLEVPTGCTSAGGGIAGVLAMASSNWSAVALLDWWDNKIRTDPAVALGSGNSELVLNGLAELERYVEVTVGESGADSGLGSGTYCPAVRAHRSMRGGCASLALPSRVARLTPPFLTDHARAPPAVCTCHQPSVRSCWRYLRLRVSSLWLQDRSVLHAGSDGGNACGCSRCTKELGQRRISTRQRGCGRNGEV